DSQATALSPGESESTAFGIDAFTAEDRLRLFHFAAAEKRHEYLWVLRAFERGRANYQVLLHASDTRDLLAELAADARGGGGGRAAVPAGVPGHPGGPAGTGGGQHGRRRRGGVPEALPPGRCPGRHGPACRALLPDARRPGPDQRRPARGVPGPQGRAAGPYA